MILGDPLQRVADEAHPPRREVLQAAEIVEHLAAHRIGGQRVDREVAAGGVFRPVVGEGHSGAAAVGRNVAAQGGDLDRLAGHHRRDRAVREPRRHGLDARGLQPGHDLARGQARGQIDVALLQFKQGVAHAAADEAGRAAFGVERGEQPVQAGAGPPGGLGQLRHVSASRRLKFTIIAAVAPQIRCSCQSIS